MEERPPKKRKQQALDTKQRIFDVAVVLIEEYGYDNVQIEDISRKAGVSMGLFYKYFANKGDVISEVLIQRCDQQYVRIAETALVNLRGKDKLVKFAKDVVDYQVFHEAKNFLAISYANILQREKRIQTITSGKRPFYSIIGEAAEELIEDYKINGISAKIISNNIIQVIRGAVFDYLLKDGTVPSQDIVDNAGSLIEGYLTGIIQRYGSK